MAKVLVSMPDDFLNSIDKYADNEQRSRSEFIREALRSYIRKGKITNPELNEERAQQLEEMLG